LWAEEPLANAAEVTQQAGEKKSRPEGRLDFVGL
jgi:hypothetical protein